MMKYPARLENTPPETVNADSFDLRRAKVVVKTVFVKRRGSNPKLDTDVSEAIGHTVGNETGLGRPFFTAFADTPLRL